jgi:hypothetical protein
MMITRGVDAEADHFMKCPGCGEWLDMRDLGQLLAHIWQIDRAP